VGRWKEIGAFFHQTLLLWGMLENRIDNRYGKGLSRVLVPPNFIMSQQWYLVYFKDELLL
jgi:hypothetical protein